MFFDKVLRENIDHTEVNQLLKEGAYIYCDSFPETVIFLDEIEGLVSVSPAKTNKWVFVKGATDKFDFTMYDSAILPRGKSYKEVQLSDEGLQYLKDNFESFSFLKDR